MGNELAIRRDLTPSPMEWRPPPQLTAEHLVEGSRNRRWLAIQLKANERPAMQTAYQAIEARLVPAEPQRIIALLMRLANHFRKDRTAAEWTALAHDYVEDLCEFSEPHIAEAVRRHRRERSWFPKVAELRETLVQLAAHDRLMHHRARVLLGQEKPNFLEQPPEQETGPARDMGSVLHLIGVRV